MIPPSRIGELSNDLLRQAALREGLPRAQRVQLGAATLLAFVLQLHESDAREVLAEAAILAGDHAHATAEHALNALAEVGALLDTDCDETRVALYNPRATVSAIRDVLDKAADGLRPTWPPYEERAEHDGNNEALSR
jgi:hypothetical protein